MSVNRWIKKVNREHIQCSCSSWKKHVEFHSIRAWPLRCSVKGCRYAALVGMPAINGDYDGVAIIPVCEACEKQTTYFDISGGVTLIAENRCKKVLQADS